jgi:type IV pilus assembly protein PilF
MKWFKLSLSLIIGLVSLWGCGTSEQAKEKATLHYRMGFQHLQQGDSSSALRELLEAEKLNPKDPSIHFALGMTYNAKGRYTEGLEQYQKVLELDPKFTEAHNAMGATYLELGKWDEAIREFEITLQDLLYLTPFYVLNNIGWAYYKKGDPQKAIENFKKAIAMKPDFGLAHYNMGLVYKDNNQREEAIASFRSAIAQVPNLGDAHFQLGVLYFNAGKQEDAKKSFQEVVRIAPKSETARLAQQYLELLKKTTK